MTVEMPDLEATILRCLEEASPARSIAPETAARAAAREGEDWHRLLPAVRKAAIRLAEAGRLVILRKGKPVDPTDFKGVYRLALPSRLDASPQV